MGLAGIAAIALGWHAVRLVPSACSDAGVSEFLGRITGARVEPGAYVWEPSRGTLADLAWGRPLLFMATPRGQESRDIFRAWVRLTPGGQPLSVVSVRNLTDTPLGDDAGLILRGSHAAYATAAFGRVQSVSVLDLAGIARSRLPAQLWPRALTRISAMQEQGSFDGLGRTDLVLHLPPRGVRLRLGPSSLSVFASGEDREFSYDVTTDRLSTSRVAGGDEPPARVVPQMYGGKPFVLWAVDTVRAEVGPEPIAWLEQKVFSARDILRRAAYSAFGAESGSKGESKLSATGLPAPDLAEVAGRDTAWPPPRIPSLWQKSAAGEGEWHAVEYALLPKPRAFPGAPAPPPYFFETFIRPDPERPYSKLWLTAMDTRQLDLRMQAGYEDPKPLTGPPGDGRLPEDADLQKRVVATFNGAFKTTHGQYGMMVDRRVLLPPEPAAATVVVTQDGRVGLGSWPESKAIPDEIVSFRQNLDPLVADGIANPSGRFVWGWQIAGESVLTQRTALCVTAAGYLYYAWAEEIDGPTLARGLRQAGCAYAIHLDMNPGHCAFIYTNIVDAAREEYKLRLARVEMQSNPARYLRWSAKDFFYATLRDPSPHRPKGLEWAPDGGVQPPPAWMPGILKASKQVGAMQIELLAFERGRVEWRVRAGSREPALLNAPPMQLTLSTADAARVIGAIHLGHATQVSRYGLAFGGSESIPLRDESATLLLGPGAPPRLVRANETLQLASNIDAVQLPWLAEDGQLTPEGQEQGANRLRGALCITPEQRVLVARATHDSSGPLASLLLSAGCTNVVELDRGSHHPSLVDRAGTSQSPEPAYDASVIYLLARPPEERAFLWKPDAEVAASTPATPTGT